MIRSRIVRVGLYSECRTADEEDIMSLTGREKTSSSAEASKLSQTRIREQEMITIRQK